MIFAIRSKSNPDETNTTEIEIELSAEDIGTLIQGGIVELNIKPDEGDPLHVYAVARIRGYRTERSGR